MDWITWMIIGVGVLFVGGVLWLTTVGWFKYPEERGKGSWFTDNWTTGSGL